MHFFEKQKVDQIGVISVALQKVLIFLMLVNVFSLFSAGGFLSLFLCLIGLIGAVRRRPCLLMLYFTISLVMLVLGIFVGIYVSFYFALDTDYYGSGSASSSSSLSEATFSTVPTSFARNVMRRVFSDSSSSSSSSASAAAASESMASGSYFTSSWEEYSDSTTYFLTFLVLLLGFFLLYMKIFSMVLALRLRKMILSATPVLPTEYRVPTENVDNSCGVEYSDEAVEMQTQGAPIAMPAPFFNQPGYMPFTPIPMPNMQQYPGNPSMVPPPMMYGQYPVYYSFAPIPPQHQQPAAPAEDSKL